MALTLAGHKIASSVSGTDFGVYSDGTYSFQGVIIRASSYYNLTGIAATHVVKASAGVLQRITLNTAAAGTATVYDDAAGVGTLIATLNSGAAETWWEFNCAFANGLTIITSGAPEMTVIFD